MANWFKAKYNWKEAFKLLTPNEVGEIMIAIFNNIQPEGLSEKAMMAYMIISADVLEDKERRESISEKRAEAGSKGGLQKAKNIAMNSSQSDALANASKSSNCYTEESSLANASKSSNCYDGESKRKEPKENITHSLYINNNTKSDCVEGVQGESEKAAPKQKRFVPPTVDDVKAYITEKGYAFSAERFVAYYESNGWRVGKNPMKDWKAACRTWAGNNYDTPTSKPVIKTKVTTEMQYDQRPNTEPDGEEMPQWLVDRLKQKGA